jgi:MoaA/NifB/PqqE/SkfB family radical SAM enzyme
MSILTKIIKKMVPKDIHTYRTLHPPLPKHIYIDPSSYCQLQCPLCPTGTRTIKLDKQMMSLTDFKRYIDHFRIIKQIDLYNWGEPFLNPQLLDIIRYAKSKNIFVTIDSNFSLYFTDKKLDDILSSGLDVLRVALDGATQKSYNAYRKNGNFPLVLDNLRRLRQRQNITGKGTLQINMKSIRLKKSQRRLM